MNIYHYIDNDFVKFIGYKIDLEKIKDNEGVMLWENTSKKMYANKKPDKMKIIKLLNEVPFTTYYLFWEARITRIKGKKKY